jgi:phosphoribosylanthranilate isomerase
MRVQVKICCIRSVEEALLALRMGADSLGLVSEMPSGPGVSTLPEIASIVTHLPPKTSSFLLTSKQSVEEIVEQQKATGANTLQLVDALPEGSHIRLRQMLPDVRLVQVIHVLGYEAVEEALSFAPQVDALLLDSGNPNLTVKELGGTGRTHNWEVSREIVERSPVPVYLAGGLTPTNVCEAIGRVRPYGIDLCSSVRTQDCLDEEKLAHFFRAVRGCA